MNYIEIQYENPLLYLISPLLEGYFKIVGVAQRNGGFSLDAV